MRPAEAVGRALFGLGVIGAGLVALYLAALGVGLALRALAAGWRHGIGG